MPLSLLHQSVTGLGDLLHVLFVFEAIGSDGETDDDAETTGSD